MIYLAADHAGFELKEAVKALLLESGYEVEDCGALTFDPNDDYPNIIYPAAEKVASSQDSKGIIFGKSGEGEAMVANKVAGVRAAVYYGGQPDIVQLSREHNDANILSLAAGFIKVDEAIKVIQDWLSVDFAAGRHQRRVEEISQLEERGYVKVLPAVLSTNIGDFIRKIKAAEKITDEVQIDIVDNKFARNLTINARDVASIQTKLTYEIQLMVEFIEDWIDPFVKIKPKRIVVPYESARDPLSIIHHLRDHGIEIGFSINPETEVERLQHLIDKIDTVLVLSVHPGFSGQHFVHGALAKIKALRQMQPEIIIEIDGAIEPGTARKAAEAGANLLCSGSYIFENDKMVGETYEDRVRNAYQSILDDLAKINPPL